MNDICKKENREQTVTTTASDPACAVDEIDSAAAELANVALEEESHTHETVHKPDSLADTAAESCAVCSESSPVSNSVAASCTVNSDGLRCCSPTVAVSADEPTSCRRGRRRRNRSTKKIQSTGNTVDRCMVLCSPLMKLDSYSKIYHVY